MKTIILLFCLVTLMDLTLARPELQQEGVVEKRFIGGLFKKMKETVQNIGGAIKNTTKTLVNKMESLASKVKNIFKKAGANLMHVEDEVEKEALQIARTFERGAKLIGRMVKKDGQIIGHFFKCEIKKVVHFLVKGGSVIEHIGEQIYFEAKAEFQKLTKDIDFDDVLQKVIPLIDSSITTSACAAIVSGVVGAITHGYGALGFPLYVTVCKAGLHLVRSVAEVLIKDGTTTIASTMPKMITP